MKYFVCFLILAVLINAQEVNRLAILPFQISGSQDSQKAKVALDISETLRTQITQKEMYSVLSTKDLQTVLEKNQTSTTQIYDLATRMPLLKQLSQYYQYQIEGELVFRDSSQIAVSVRLLQLDNMQVVKSAAALGEIQDLGKLSRAIISQILPTTQKLLQDVQKAYVQAVNENNYAVAVKLCDWMLLLQPGDWKFHYQRAQTYERVKNYSRAADDYNAAVNKPGADSAKIKEALQKIAPLLEKIKQRRKVILKSISKVSKILERRGGIIEQIEIMGETIQVLQKSEIKKNGIDGYSRRCSSLHKRALLLAENLRLAQRIDPSQKNNEELEFLLTEYQQVKTEASDIRNFLKVGLENESQQFIGRAKQFLGQKDYVKAMRELEKVYLVAPDMPEGYYWRGIVLAEADNGRYAIKNFSMAIKKSPTYWEAFYSRAQLYSKLKKPNQALQDFTKVLEIQPSHAITHYHRGEILTELNRSQEALQSYSKAIQYDPSLTKAYFARGKLYDRLQEYQEAQADYRTIIEKDEKLRGQALPLLEKLLSYAKSDARIYYDKAQDMVEQGDLHSALSNYDLSLQLDKEFVHSYLGRALTYQKLGRYEDAIRDYREALILDKNSAKIHFYRAVSLNLLGKYEDAIKDLSKAIEYEPGFHQAYHRRGNIYESLAQYEQALKDYSRAIDLISGKAHYYFDRARIYKILNKWPESNRDKVHAREIRK